MRILLLCFCVFFLLHCSERQRMENRKDAYIRSFNKFIERVEKNAPGFTKADWETADEELDQWTGIKRHDIQEALTNEDEAFVNELESRFETAYAQYLKQRILNGIKETVKDAKKEIREGVEDLIEK